MSTNKKFILPEIVEIGLTVMNPNASEKELSVLKAMAVEQIAFNERRAEELKADFPPTRRMTTAFVQDYIGYGSIGGKTTGPPPTNGSNIKGPPNGAYAQFYTTCPPATAMYAICTMTATSRTADVYAYAKKGPSAKSSSDVIVYASNNNMTSWFYVGTATVTTATAAPSSGKYFIGSTLAFTHIAVGTATLSPSTSPSDILVDTIVTEF
jgi:hypothetical protein